MHFILFAYFVVFFMQTQGFAWEWLSNKWQFYEYLFVFFIIYSYLDLFDAFKGKVSYYLEIDKLNYLVIQKRTVRMICIKRICHLGCLLWNPALICWYKASPGPFLWKVLLQGMIFQLSCTQEGNFDIFYGVSLAHLYM